jgi:hypothetical protein
MLKLQMVLEARVFFVNPLRTGDTTPGMCWLAPREGKQATQEPTVQA